MNLPNYTLCKPSNYEIYFLCFVVYIILKYLLQGNYMKKINPKKVFTEFRDGVNKIEPIEGRKYTVTHSDKTGDLFVTIGLKYAEDKIDKLRDELLLTWTYSDERLKLIGQVLIDNEVIKNSRIRNIIFKKEMPLALQAIRYADRELFQLNKSLDDIPIEIQFISQSEKYNKLIEFGSMKEYEVQNFAIE